MQLPTSRKHNNVSQKPWSANTNLLVVTPQHQIAREQRAAQMRTHVARRLERHRVARLLRRLETARLDDRRASVDADDRWQIDRAAARFGPSPAATCDRSLVASTKRTVRHAQYCVTHTSSQQADEEYDYTREYDYTIDKLLARGLSFLR
jgi:hypothetical protein